MCSMYYSAYWYINLVPCMTDKHNRTNSVRLTRKMVSVALLLYCFFVIASARFIVNPQTFPAFVTTKCSQSNSQLNGQLTETLRQIQYTLSCSLQNRSCREILNCFPSAPSGYYQIHAPNGSLVQVYCDMEGTNCGGEGGWMRVAYVNMSQSGTTCPQGLTQKVLSGLTLCGRSDTSVGSCQSTFFSSLGLNYSQVCGQLRGYQWATPDAFTRIGKVVPERYVDGATITYGNSPRKHIWTYANGVSLYYSTNSLYVCPCNTGAVNIVPSFVGSDYYCETGFNGNGEPTYNFLFSNDPLWDGQQCVGTEAPCCTHPNMPWFNKTLSETTTEDIEVRVCLDQNTSDEDTLLQVIELFIY